MIPDRENPTDRHDSCRPYLGAAAAGTAPAAAATAFMIGRLLHMLREWLLADLVVCAQCRCLADRHHGSAACGRHLRDTTHEQHMRHEQLAARLRELVEKQSTQSREILALQVALDDPFRDSRDEASDRTE